jgi:Domain of Unknown Function (DUF928)
MKKLLPLLALVAIAVAGSASAQQPSQAGGQLNPPPAANPQNMRPKRVHTDLSGFELSPKPATQSSSVQTGGGTRGGLPSSRLYAPLRGKSYTATPTFYWSTSKASSDFKLTVYDSDYKVTYETTIHGNSFAYPSSAPTLEPGRTYSWTVQPEGTVMAEPAQEVEILLLSAEERNTIDHAQKEIAGNSLREQMKRAEVLVKARLWYDSIAIYSELVDKYPDRSELYNRRGEIYDQIPATRDLADKDFRRAEEMHRQPQPK